MNLFRMFVGFVACLLGLSYGANESHASEWRERLSRFDSIPAALLDTDLTCEVRIENVFSHERITTSIPIPNSRNSYGVLMYEARLLTQEGLFDSLSITSGVQVVLSDSDANKFNDRQTLRFHVITPATQLSANESFPSGDSALIMKPLVDKSAFSDSNATVFTELSTQFGVNSSALSVYASAWAGTPAANGIKRLPPDTVAKEFDTTTGTAVYISSQPTPTKDASFDIAHAYFDKKGAPIELILFREPKVGLKLGAVRSHYIRIPVSTDQNAEQVWIAESQIDLGSCTQIVTARLKVDVTSAQKLPRTLADVLSAAPPDRIVKLYENAGSAHKRIKVRDVLKNQ